MVFERTTAIEEVLIMIGIGNVWLLAQDWLAEAGVPWPMLIATGLCLMLLGYMWWQGKRADKRLRNRERR